MTFADRLAEETGVRTWVDLVKHIENTLGWCIPWDDPRPAYKVRAIEAGKVKRVATKKGHTVKDLLVAVEYLRQRKKPVKAPSGVVYHVEDAIHAMRGETREDLDVQREEVLAEVRALSDENERSGWMSRFAHAQGSHLRDAIEEWYSR